MQEESFRNPIFISRIESLLKEKSLTQNELGRLTNISQATISSYLKGRTAPKSAELSRLADYFGCSMDYLWGRAETSIHPDHINPGPESDLLKRAKTAEQKLVRLKTLIQNLGSDVQSLGESVNKLTIFISEEEKQS